mmetsp:Transcript_5737/g.19524  ORF Transcript_5737/g.19524 Transcript_5737/m.19524 type:complete len:269 (+) Transcript_5737:904-1710(+)
MSRTVRCTPMALSSSPAPRAVHGLPLSCSDRSAVLTRRASAMAMAPSSSMAFFDRSRCWSVALRRSTAATSRAPRTPMLFHARLTRCTVDCTRPAARRATPSARREFQDTSRSSRALLACRRSARLCAPAGEIWLSATSSLVSVRLPASAHAIAPAPASPTLLPRRDRSRRAALFPRAGDICAQPRAPKLLYARLSTARLALSAIASAMWSTPPASASRPRPSWLSSRSKTLMQRFTRMYSKSATPPLAPTPRCLRLSTSASIIATSC